jgi:hypothetical protein
LSYSDIGDDLIPIASQFSVVALPWLDLEQSGEPLLPACSSPTDWRMPLRHFLFVEDLTYFLSLSTGNIIKGLQKYAY